MNRNETTRKLLLEHIRRYPELQIEDVFKFLYQSSFGCEHMVSSEEYAISKIESEFCEVAKNSSACIEALDGNYSRVPLKYMDNGLSAETLGKLFSMSAKKEPSSFFDLEEKLKITEQLISQGLLPFSLNDFSASLDIWRHSSYPSLHHSEQFRKLYSPSYRVISNEFIPFLPLFAKIDSLMSQKNVILAIDGPCASGKTTLALLLERLYSCSVFHMDDFFLRPHQRTPERFAEIGGNVDRERFSEEVLVPLFKNEPVTFHRFDCSTLTLSAPITVKSTPLTVVEGSYSMHPELSTYYTISVFLDISADEQKKRILKRNSPQLAKRFFSEWIPLENRYFQCCDIKNKCNLVIPILK